MTTTFPLPLYGKVAVFALLPFAEPATGASANGPAQFLRELETYATSTGSVCPTAPHPVAEIRRISGLTFEQLSNVFQVSRRTLHLWISGQRMQPANEERAQRIIACLRLVDRGAPDLTRAALLERGARALDLLKEGAFREVEAQLGRGIPPRQPALPPIPDTDRAARTPAPPADLVDASQDAAHPAARGVKRIAGFKFRRAKRGK